MALFNQCKYRPAVWEHWYYQNNAYDEKIQKKKKKEKILSGEEALHLWKWKLKDTYIENISVWNYMVPWTIQYMEWNT